MLFLKSVFLIRRRRFVFCQRRFVFCQRPFVFCRRPFLARFFLKSVFLARFFLKSVLGTFFQKVLSSQGRWRGASSPSDPAPSRRSCASRCCDGSSAFASRRVCVRACGGSATHATSSSSGRHRNGEFYEHESGISGSGFCGPFLLDGSIFCGGVGRSLDGSIQIHRRFLVKLPIFVPNDGILPFGWLYG